MSAVQPGLPSLSCLMLPSPVRRRAFLLILLLVPSLRAETLSLNNAGSTATIDPATLLCRWQPAGKRMVELSAAQAPAKVSALKQEDSRLEWSLPDPGIRIQAELEAEILTLRFSAEKPGTFTWPVIMDPAILSWALPLHEGVLVPADDAGWIRHLAESGPLDTTADFGMAFWGQRYLDLTVSAILTNPFNNQVKFGAHDSRLSLSLTHEFTSTQKRKEYAVRFRAGGLPPVEAARHFRDWLKERGEFVSLAEKIRQTPDAAKLAGAAHVYLWGQDPLALEDVSNWPQLLRLLQSPHPSEALTPAGHLTSLMKAETRQLLKTLSAKTEPLNRYEKSQIVEALNLLLRHPDFYKPEAWEGLPLPPETRALLVKPAVELNAPDLLRRNGALLAAAFPNALADPANWGDGVCSRMIRDLAEAGFDRLWLGSDSWRGLVDRPETVTAAKERGFLIGPYDSYHSMHPPGMADTWETAQLGAAIYGTGGILSADGNPRKGFQQKGRLLSPIAAQPLVEERINKLLQAFPANSWFMDCDAFGQFFDDYTPSRPASQADDAAARCRRLAWIRDHCGLVVGSEGCSAPMASTIHFAHGVMTPTLGWGDADMRDKKSPFFQGAYYPPNGPAIFFKPIPLKEEYHTRHFDPRFRLPLFETVFHDSVVATHHWGSGSLKFRDEIASNELLELLYGVPPLWHLNRAELAERKKQLLRHYAVFSPLHREIMTSSMTDFQWLTPDRLVQKTTFGDKATVTVNFGDTAFSHEGQTLPPRSAAIRRAGGTEIYQP